MQNALKMSFGITKRAFTIAVVVATIAWSVAATFAIAPRMASAAVSSGDLVKGSLSAVYYIGSDGKRYVFTNDKAYFSWYTDFSTVKKISDTELAAVTIGGNVTYKPGVKMVKIQSDPKVYAVAHGGVLRWVATEAVAVALFGATWNKQIDDIGDAFFVNYTVGTQISSASDYVVATEQANSVTINADKGLAGGGAINVTLASDNPQGMALTNNAQSINLLKVNFAGTGTVTGLTFKRNGAGVAADWANIYLFDGDTRLSTGRSVSSATNEAVFSGLNIAVAGSKAITLTGDLAVGAIWANSHYFSLEAATKVVASTTVGGTFPVNGQTFSISGSAGGGLTLAVSSTPSNPKVGQQAAEIANLRLTGGANEDVILRRLTFTNSGSASLNNLLNMKLVTGSTTVASNPIISSNMVTFVLAVPYTIARGTNRIFTVTADIAAANRPGTDTIRFYVDQTYDVYATGVTYGAGVAITNNFTAALAPPVPPLPAIGIDGGQITMVMNGPSTGDISVGGNDVVLEKFAITAANHVEIRTLRARLTFLAALGVEVPNVTDIKIKNMDTGSVVAGPFDLATWTLAVAGPPEQYTRLFTDRFELAAGQTLNLAITADILAAALAPLVGTTVTAQVDARVLGDIRNLDSTTDVATTDMVPSTALTANAQTIRASGMTVGLASSPTSATVTKGATANALGINFTAGSASDVKVTQIRLRGYVSLTNGIGGVTNTTFTTNDAECVTDNPCVAGATHRTQDVVQSMTIWDGTTEVGTPKSPDTNGDVLFNSLTWSIPAGTTKTLTVKAVISNNAPYGLAPNVLMVDLLGTGTTAGTNNVTAEDKDANTITPTSVGWVAGDSYLNWTVNGGAADADFINVAPAGVPFVAISPVASGTLQVAIDGDTPTAALITAYTNDNSVTRLKFTSINEAFQVTRMTVENTNGASSRSITSVRLFDKAGTLFCSGALDTNNRLRCANDAGLFTVANDQVVTIKLNLDQEGSGTTGANSGDTPVMALYVDPNDAVYTDDIKVIGVSSGTALVDVNERDRGFAQFGVALLKLFDDSAADEFSAGNNTYISGSQFVIRKTQPTVATVATSTTLINGEMTVYKFSVTAASNADVALKQFNLTMSRSGVALGSYRIFENGTALDPVLYTILSSGIAVVADPIDLKTAGALGETNNGGTINVLFRSERTVAAGTTKTYDIKATVSAAASGDSLTHVMSDDARSIGTSDAGMAMNLGSDFCILDGTHALFNLDRDACLVDAGESEMTIPGGAQTNAQIGNYITSGSLMTDGTDIFIDLNGNGAYTAAADISIGLSAVANAHTTVDYTLIDNGGDLFFDVNYNGVYNAGTDIVLTDTTNLTAAGLVNTLGSNFVWSDTSGDAHSIITGDWTNGFHVKTLPTSAQSLSL